MSKTIITTIGIGLVLAGCSAAPAKTSPSTDPDKAWVLASRPVYASNMEAITNEMGYISDAMNRGDRQTASWHASAVSQKMRVLADKVVHLPQTNTSTLGRDSVGVLNQCSLAYGQASIAAASLVGLDDSTAAIHTCSEGMKGLTVRVRALGLPPTE